MVVGRVINDNVKIVPKLDRVALFQGVDLDQGQLTGMLAGNGTIHVMHEWSTY